MGFKESLQEDLNNVFFNPEEFASEHTIDGEKITIVFQEVSFVDAMKNRSARAAFNPKETAVNKNTVFIYIQEEEVKKLKRKKFTANSMITLDGRRYFVSEVRTEGGVTKLTATIAAM